MVELQLRSRGIDDERVLEAMERVPREEFLPPGLRARAYDDAALPTGESGGALLFILALASRIERVGGGRGYEESLAELATIRD